MKKMNKNYFNPKSVIRLLSLFVLLTSPITGFAQNLKMISGTVISSEDQMPLPGVNIVVEGTNNATVTDFDGNFSLEIPQAGATLTISYVGFKTQTIDADSQTNFDLVLEPDVAALSEVVVVGYGKVKKTDLTGSVGSVGAESLTERNITNPVEALQGNVPGVQISNTTGRVGDGFNITIRGKNSVSGNVQPLFVVDGVPTGDIDFLNPQDIERIDVLKDASSTAIYGSRGSNGVVIVTTKSGAGAKQGLNISFESFVGIKQVARLPKLMDPQRWWSYHQSAYLPTAAVDPATGTVTPQTLFDAVSAGGQNSELFRRVDANESFDWYDAVLKSGIQQNNYLNVSGRSENGVGYNLGLGYQKETGNIDNESLEKYTLKLGVDHNINEKFTMGANATVTLTEQNLGSDLALQEAFRLNPFLNPYGLDGDLFPLPGKLTDANGDFIINKTSTYNPLLEIQNTTDDLRTWNIIGNTYFQYQALDWLSFKTTFSAGYESTRQGRAWGAQTNTGISNNDLPSAYLSNYENFNYTWDNQFNIYKTFNDIHSFNLLGLYSIYSNRTETSFQSSRNMPFETGFYNIGSGEQSTYNLGSNFFKQTLTSYALRLNYSLLDRYLITLSNRWDGSSLLSDANRWDSFPSAAIAWRMTEENFLKNQTTLSNLKLRVSYGYTGNNIIDPYSTLNILNTQTYYDYNGTTANGYVASALANSQLGWEKTRELNVGLDFGFLRDRIEGSVDIYDRLSDDLLLQQQLPSETGFESINANVGSVRNSGVEVSLTTRNIQSESVTWNTTFNFTKNSNKIESIYGQDEVDDIGNNLFIGESIDALYNYQFDGIWQADETELSASYGMEEGQAKIRDINGDGQFTPDGDRVILGSSNPDWTGNIFSTLKVKNFDLSASINIVQGVDVLSPYHQNFTDTRDRGRQKLDIDWYVPVNNAGLPTQYTNSYPQPRNEGTYWINDGIGYYRDASFVKVKNIALGYNFDRDLLEKLNLKKFRIYMNVLNPFVFTDYTGYDPEWAAASLAIGRPSSITYQLGFNLNF